jgi:hypothetical protein
MKIFMKLRLEILLTFLIISNGLTLFGQNIEIFGGVNYNIFHEYYNYGGTYNSSFVSKLGYSAGFGIDDVKLDPISMRFTLQFDKYGGDMKASEDVSYMGYTTEASIDKWIITLGIFPLNFRLFHKIDLNVGFEISRLIDDTFKGSISGWLNGQSDWSHDLHEIYDHYSSLMHLGLKGRIAYDFNLSKSLIITPQYLYYFGFSNELQGIPYKTKSMRHYFCIGIKKKIK